MTNQTSAAELQLNESEHPRTGQTRRYVKNWAEVCGLEIARYNTGNISGAWINGEKIPNGRAGAILAAKVWLDEGDGVHVDGLSDYAQAYLTAEDIEAAIEEALNPTPAEEKAEAAALEAAAEIEKKAGQVIRSLDAVDTIYKNKVSESVRETIREQAMEKAALVEEMFAEFSAAQEGASDAVRAAYADVEKAVLAMKAVTDPQEEQPEPAAADEVVENPAEPEPEAEEPAMPTTLPAQLTVDALRTIKEVEAQTDHLNLRAGDIITMADRMDQYLTWGELTQAAGDLLDTLATLPRHGRVQRLEERLRAMEARYLREETTIVTDATRRFPEYLAAGPEAARYTSETIAHKASVLVETTLAGIDQANANRDNAAGFQSLLMIAHIRANLLRFDCEQLAALWFINPEDALRERYAALRDQVRATHLRLVEANSGPDRLFLNKFAFDHGSLLCAMKTEVVAALAPRGRKLSPGERKFVDTLRRWHPEIKVSIARKMFGLLLGLPRFGDEIEGSTIDTMTETEFLRWETVVAIDWVLR